MKRTVVYSMKVAIQTQSIALFTSAGNDCVGQLQVFYFLPMSTNDDERATYTDLGLQINFTFGKLVNTESTNNTDRLYFKLNHGHLTGNVKIMRFHSG